MSAVRAAGPQDAAPIARLLHAFNAEFGEPSPGPEVLTARLGELLAGDETAALLAGDGPDGLVLMRFRAGLWTDGLECYVAELYVVPERRGHGLGRALMQASMELARNRGADHMDLGTSEDDTAARGLYESLGFVNRERPPDGPIMYFYERDL